MPTPARISRPMDAKIQFMRLDNGWLLYADNPSLWTNLIPNPANTIRKFLVREVSLAWVSRFLVAQGRDGRGGSGLIALSSLVALADCHFSLLIGGLFVVGYDIVDP